MQALARVRTHPVRECSSSGHRLRREENATAEGTTNEGRALRDSSREGARQPEAAFAADTGLNVGNEWQLTSCRSPP